LTPTLFGQDLSKLFLQTFHGDVTVHPPVSLLDWLRLISMPTRAEFAAKIEMGQRMTWPKIPMISNRLRIEQTLERLLMELKQELLMQQQQQHQAAGLSSTPSRSRPLSKVIASPTNSSMKGKPLSAADDQAVIASSVPLSSSSLSKQPTAATALNNEISACPYSPELT
jgi:hypothetical protein